MECYVVVGFAHRLFHKPVLDNSRIDDVDKPKKAQSIALNFLKQSQNNSFYNVVH